MTNEDLRVWLIDEWEPDNFLSRSILNECGVKNILVFPNTVTAMNEIMKTPVLPHIVFLEIYFPIMNGFEFLDMVNKMQLPQRIYFSFLTASVNPADKCAADERSCDGFIDKPLTSEKLHTFWNKLSK